MIKSTYFLLLIFVTTIFSQSGEELFNTKCAACHTVGKGKLVGPDLAGVTTRRPEEWLLKFIKSSQALVNSGDDYAKKRFEEFNKVIMPDQPMNDAEIKSILNYVSNQGSSSTQTASIQLKPLSTATQQNIENGKLLFTGEARFQNGGASCVSCHNVPSATVLGGGSLAIDLTNAYSRLSEAGLTNIIMTRPFPVMNKAFADNPLTEQEAFDLASYLKNVDEQSKTAVYQNYSPNLLYSGFGGFAALLILISVYWRNRKKNPVSAEIYKRQDDYIRKNS